MHCRAWIMPVAVPRLVRVAHELVCLLGGPAAFEVSGVASHLVFDAHALPAAERFSTLGEDVLGRVQNPFGADHHGFHLSRFTKVLCLSEESGGFEGDQVQREDAEGHGPGGCSAAIGRVLDTRVRVRESAQAAAAVPAEGEKVGRRAGG